MADLDTLRRAYRGANSGGQSMHLSEERWELLACDELSSEDRETALDHIVSCALCADTYKALQILRSEARAFDPTVPGHDEDSSRRGPSRRGLWGGLGFLALAAVVMMAIALPYFFPQTPDSGNGTLVLRSVTSQGPVTPVFPVDQTIELDFGGNIVLRWSGPDPAPPAVVEILDGDGEIIWTSPETEASEVRWPKNVTATPGRYYWRVIVTGDGDKKISSALVSFDLTSSRP